MLVSPSRECGIRRSGALLEAVRKRFDFELCDTAASGFVDDDAAFDELDGL